MRTRAKNIRWVFVLLLLPALPGVASAQLSKLDEAAKQLVARLKPLKPSLVAIADFNSSDGSSPGQAHYLSWYLSSALEEYGKKKLRVVDHKTFDMDLSAIFPSRPAALTAQALHDNASRVRGDIVIIGNVVDHDGYYSLEFTPVLVAQGTALESLRTSIGRSDFLDSLLAPFPAGDVTPPRAGAGGTAIPRCTYCPDPSYTNLARAVKVQGIVVMELIISKDGRVQHLHPLKFLGYGLDEAAYNTIKSWRFTPVTDKQGTPFEVRIPVEVNFRLY